MVVIGYDAMTQPEQHPSKEHLPCHHLLRCTPVAECTMHGHSWQLAWLQPFPGVMSPSLRWLAMQKYSHS
jgi:hypothetical protein